MFDALCDGLEGHFLGIRRGVELHEEEVTFFNTFTNVFFIFVTFYVFNVFLFLFERFFTSMTHVSVAISIGCSETRSVGARSVRAL